MENIENKENLRVEENVVDNTDYIAAIEELKQKSVDKAKYDALRLENKKLIQTLVNGEVVETPMKDMDKKLDEKIDSLRNSLFGKNTESMTNLEYWDKTLKLRKALIERGDIDPFVPQGNKVSATQADYDKAEKVASIMQEMVDNAEGDPNVFLNEYQRRVKDTNLRKK